MGTGGSLRLLSPETKLGLVPLVAAHPLPAGSAVEWPPGFVKWSRLQLKGFAPSKPHRSESLARPSDLDRLPSLLRHSLRFGFSPWFRFPSLRFRFVPFSYSLLPTPYSLFFQDQALDRLVSPSSIRYRTSTDDLSTLSSSRGLTLLLRWQLYSLGGLHA